MKDFLHRWKWTLLVGTAFGFALRLAWEKWPAVRLVTGGLSHLGDAAMLLPNSTPPSAGSAERFSLDAIAASGDPAAEMRRWRQTVEAMSPQRRREWLHRDIEVSGSGIRRFMSRMVGNEPLREEIDRWILLSKEVIDAGGDALMASALVNLARLDLALAFDAAEVADSSGATSNHSAVVAVLMAMAETDPDAALQTARERQIESQLLPFVTTIQALRDPDRALPALLKASEKTQAFDISTLLARLMSQRPAAEALALCRSADGHFDARALSFLEKDVTAERAAELLQVLKGGDAAMQQETLALRMSLLAQTDPLAALPLAIAAGQEESRLSPKFHDLVTAAAARDPEKALRIACESGNPLHRSSGITAAVSAMMARDADRGFAALRENWDTFAAAGSPSGNLGWAYAENVTRGFFEAAKDIDGLPPGDAADAIKAGFAAAWALKNPQAAVAWAQQSGSERIQNAAVATWAQLDPEVAFDHVSSFSAEVRARLFQQSVNFTAGQRARLVDATPPDALPTDLNPVLLRQPIADGTTTLGEAILARLPAEKQSPFAERVLNAMRMKYSDAAGIRNAARMVPYVADPEARLRYEEAIYSRMRQLTY